MKKDANFEEMGSHWHQKNTELVWHVRDKQFIFADRPLIMGILNVTPDSFSDGGKYFTKELAVKYALEMIEEGADIIDIGGESSRPGSLPVPEEEELRRVVPVVEELFKQSKNVIISVDTRKSNVAQKALEAGAHIINDISALRADENMIQVVKSYSAGVILMHMKGEPATMQLDPSYDDVVKEVKHFLEDRIAFCTKNGLKRNFLAIDPGIGFGKTTHHNLRLIANLDAFLDLEVPIVIGLSRKRFIGELTGRKETERIYGTLAANVFASLRGVHIIRVHDVKATVDAIKIITAIAKEQEV